MREHDQRAASLQGVKSTFREKQHDFCFQIESNPGWKNYRAGIRGSNSGSDGGGRAFLRR